MTAAEIDRLESAWMAKLMETIQQAMGATATDLHAKGHDREEVREILTAQSAYLPEWIAERRKDIRSLILTGYYGVEPLLADGTSATTVSERDARHGPVSGHQGTPPH
ncbi:hypothetical protein IL54_2558 [Sphingobium sp. ba1]|jgi:hypothetical protein|uniref:hypothetical protein n=1 Tax=Sphingobium sp. ba1 TaxID=1522072 RepID=UPI0005060167|nr:hypothetical protein [Sphingobium sp. ba1]KFL47135.1 hypothetical protein IL54_2558 [Sphingobium sp. ba1]